MLKTWLSYKVDRSHLPQFLPYFVCCSVENLHVRLHRDTHQDEKSHLDYLDLDMTALLSLAFLVGH